MNGQGGGIKDVILEMKVIWGQKVTSCLFLNTLMTKPTPESQTCVLS